MTKIQNSNILFIGPDGVGKTTLLYQLKLNEIVKTLPTIGYNIENINYKDREITIFDIGGDKKFKHLWKSYIEKNCIVYNDIKICSSSKTNLEDTNIKVVETTISNSEYDAVMDAYSITSDLKRQTYKIYIPIDKVQVEYNSLDFLTNQVSDNDTSLYPLSITNDFKYYKANFYIKDYEGIFTIVESD